MDAIYYLVDPGYNRAPTTIQFCNVFPHDPTDGDGNFAALTSDCPAAARPEGQEQLAPSEIGFPPAEPD